MSFSATPFTLCLNTAEGEDFLLVAISRVFDNFMGKNSITILSFLVEFFHHAIYFILIQRKAMPVFLSQFWELFLWGKTVIHSLYFSWAFQQLYWSMFDSAEGEDCALEHYLELYILYDEKHYYKFLNFRWAFQQRNLLFVWIQRKAKTFF